MGRFEHWRYTLPLRLRSLFRRNRVEQEMDEELAFHLAMQVELEMERGLSEREAHTAARRRFGGFVDRSARPFLA